MAKNLFKIKATIASVVGWGFIFLSPLLYFEPAELSFVRYQQYAIIPVFLFLLFYLNYYLLLPHYTRNRKSCFILINLFLVLFMGALIHVWMVWTDHFTHANLFPMKSVLPGSPAEWKVTFLFYIKNILALSAASGISSAIYFSLKWMKTDQKRRTLEIQQAETELENLKTKLSPHFLLNTLNNIYALTAFDTEKAQQAILQLSKLLRHILYENLCPTVSLKDEMEFVNNYIELMKIRQADNIEVTTDYDYPPSNEIQIAPLIEIPLIENAFKHGISTTQKSFIHIKVCADEERIIFEITNSNYPQTDEDKHGFGIGLKQVKTRLELLYHGKYEWTSHINKNNNTYSTKIILYDTKLRNH